MKTCFALALNLCFIAFINCASAQDELKLAEMKAAKRDSKTYTITSMDGKQRKILVAPDYPSHVLTISNGKSAIKIPDYWGVPPEVKMLNNNFMEINYAVRGGSNLGLGNTLIICLNGDRLYQSLHILEHAQWYEGILKRNYSVKLALTGNNKTNYKLTADVHDDELSTKRPEENYQYDNRSVLAFDVQRNVFYSVKVGVDANVDGIKQKVAGNFPVVILGKETYYSIYNGWFRAGEAVQFHAFK